jgi:CDP-2,3-bis-(O-geranylgeranyl)-sn-glycerol synthase
MATSACAPIIGLEWNIGAVVGSAAMAGDLFSSFVKRRVHLPASSRATGLDQIPESLFPLFVLPFDAGTDASRYHCGRGTFFHWRTRSVAIAL